MEKEELLKRWEINVTLSQQLNYQAAHYFSKLHQTLGTPAVIISSIVGASIFVNLYVQASAKNSLVLTIILGIASLSSAALTGLQTFLNFSDRASKHKLVASEYGAVKRHIQELLLLKNEIEMKDFEKVRRNMDFLARESPEIPKKIHKSILKNDIKSEKPY